MNGNVGNSEGGKLIYEALPKVIEEIGRIGVSKDRKNQQQGYSYRGIDDMYNALNPLLAKHGISVVPVASNVQRETIQRQNKQGDTTTWFSVSLLLTVSLFASDGSHVEIQVPGEGLDNSDKATNKALSAAMKYGLMMAFCVPTEEMKDADGETVATAHPAEPAAVRSEHPPTAQDTASNVQHLKTQAPHPAGGNGTRVGFPAFDPENEIVPGGKYVGKHWVDLPDDYLEYVRDNSTSQQSRDKAAATLKFKTNMEAQRAIYQ